MYLEFYGFKTKPFSLTPDPRFFYCSAVHKRALAYLTYGLDDHKGFITVSGDIGSGKTTLIRTLLTQLPADRVIAHLVNTTMDGFQLLEMIGLDFGLNAPENSKASLLKALHTFLLQQHRAHKRPLLIIDEAQNLSLEALEEIRLLSNFETDTEKLLQIVLVGQPELRAKLQQSKLRQLAQRISVSHHLSPINQEEIQGYIQHRLLVAGGQQTQLFTPQAVEQICQFSQGIPRLINVICDAALLAGYVEEEPQLNEEHIAMAVSHLGLQQATGNNEGQGQFLSAEQAPGSKTVRQLQDVCRLMEELYEKYTAQQGEVVANVERLSWLENRLTALEACLTRKLAELETRARQF